jgi:class 3 adenylate cyclase/tetratricopeptide (TPR) repeat protein
MECPNCSHTNSKGARFCSNCGHALVQICANCSTENNAAARFCQNCGNSLAEPEIKKATRPPLLDTFASERRIVTILFADVTGSTSIAEQLDPEEWTEIMNGAFAHLIPAVTRYGGTVARLMGDAVLALFGAPTAHEDDPYRAVLAALDMLEDLRPYQTRIRSRLRAAGLTPDPTDFEIRVGINTGLVVVGRVGSGQSGEYTAMGDAVNLAARMEQTAEPGMIQISNDVHRLIRSAVNAKQLGQIAVKGKTEPIQTHQVLGLKTDLSGVRAAPSLDAPMIGRDREMELLLKVLEQAQTGTGQIVNVIAEAGLGKSRLIHELKLVADERPDVDWFEAVSLSFETAQPYGLLQRLFRRVCECTQEDSPEMVRQKIVEFIDRLPNELQLAVGPVLNALFSLEVQGDAPALQGEDLKRDLFTAMHALWEHLAEKRTVVLVLDDLHWADPASVELVQHLLSIADRRSILFVCVFRPNRDSPAWTVKQLAEQKFPYRYQEIVLSPLSESESDSLVASLLPIAQFPQQARELILRKTEGNPFFVEEIVRELIESGAARPQESGQGWQLVGDIDAIDVPDSLEALLVARIDRLEESARNTLQLAAVIGRNFYYRVLALITTRVDHLDDQLRLLQQVGFIREASRLPELEYIFRHVLTQQAAYNTILLKQRRHFHQRTGEIMEELFADLLDEHAVLLAYHFLQAGDYDRALRYLIQAGENAARLYANAEAIDHYTQALAIDAARSLQPEKSIQLYRARGRICETLGQFDPALADLEMVLQIAQSAGILHEEWLAQLDLGMLWASQNYQKTGDYFRKALEIARQLDDPASLARSLNRLGNWYVNVEQPQESIQYHEEAQTIFEKLDDQSGRSATLDFLGMASLISSDLVSSLAYYREAIRLFETLGDQGGLLSSMTAMAECGPTYQTRNGFSALTLPEAVLEGERALKLSQQIGWRAAESFALWSLAQIYGVSGDFGKALPMANNGISIAIEIDHTQWMAGAYKSLGDLQADLLDESSTLENFVLAVEMAERVGSQFFLLSSSGALASYQISVGNLDGAQKTLSVIRADTPMISIGQRVCWGARGELALAQGDLKYGLEIVERMRQTAASLPADGVISVLWHLWARLLLANGQPEQAETQLRLAIRNAQYYGEKTLLWRTYRDLGHALAAQSKSEEAQAAIEEAKTLVQAIASTVSDMTLRNNFMKKAVASMSIHD